MIKKWEPFLLPDVDMCLNNPCGANAHCINNGGSYDCKCKPEYTGNAHNGCIGNDFTHVFIRILSRALPSPII